MAVGDGTAAAAAAAATVGVKVSISGAALAALLHRCTSAYGDCDGLLFGRASRLPAPPPSLSDYDDHSAAPPEPALTISVSGHSASHPASLCDPLGRFQFQLPSAPPPVGFFSSRRRTPLRPSVRELALAHSLSKTLATESTHPLLFILVSPSCSPNFSTHSYDYRAFLLIGRHLVPESLNIVNIGPEFRDQYHSFSSESPMPWLPPMPSSPAAAQSRYTIGEQKAVDEMVDGFGIERLQGVMDSMAGQAVEMNEMYEGMLRKLEKLAREVEKSDHQVLEQENRNMLLRMRYAGLN